MTTIDDRFRTTLLGVATRYREGHTPQAPWEPYPWQICPGEIASQGLWLINGGRGIGKTDGCTHYVLEHINGPACDPRIRGGHRIAIVAPTLGDAVESCVTGPSGLRSYDPDVQLRTAVGGTYVRFRNGSEARLFGAYSPEDVERLRAGGNRCLVWAEEIAAWRHLDECWKHARYGLRVGPRPHFVGSSTPKPLKPYKALLADPNTLATFGRTSDAHHLAASVRDALLRDYAGTRLGRQELEGEILEDVEGALFALRLIEAARVTDAPDLVRLVIAIDPAGTSGEDADEHGIVAVGATPEGDVYVLGDHSLRGTPQQCATTALMLLDEYGADRIIAEKNQGQDWIETVLRQIRPDVPYRPVDAKRGKYLRAQPVASLYEQGRVHHVGMLPVLEDQMCTWVPDLTPKSPDRLDALVHGVTAVTLGTPRGRQMRYHGRAA